LIAILISFHILSATMVFDKVRWMQMPREVHAGHDVISKIGEVCNIFEFQQECVIITGKETYQLAGKKVKSLLEEANYKPQILIVDESNLENLQKVENFTKKCKADFILGVGGGSKIDLAKKASYNLKLPFISVPTLASHDGVVSPIASFKNNGKSISSEASVPIAIVADTSIILKSPYKYLTAGAADVISNMTAVKDWELAYRLGKEEFSRSATTLSIYAAESILRHIDLIKPESEEAVWHVMKALIMSGIGMSIAGSSRPASGSEHLFAHALEQICDKKLLHGERVGVGTILMMYLQDRNWQRIKESLELIGDPTTASDLNVSDEAIIEAITMAHTIRERYTILGKGISKEEAIQIATETGVIG